MDNESNSRQNVKQIAACLGFDDAAAGSFGQSQRTRLGEIPLSFEPWLDSARREREGEAKFQRSATRRRAEELPYNKTWQISVRPAARGRGESKLDSLE